MNLTYLGLKKEVAYEGGLVVGAYFADGISFGEEETTVFRLSDAWLHDVKWIAEWLAMGHSG